MPYLLFVELVERVCARSLIFVFVVVELERPARKAQPARCKFSIDSLSGCTAALYTAHWAPSYSATMKRRGQTKINLDINIEDAWEAAQFLPERQLDRSAE